MTVTYGVPRTDAGPAWESETGTAATPTITSADATTAVDITEAPADGNRIIPDDIIVGAKAAMDVTIQDESGTVLYKFPVPADGTVQITPRGRNKRATAGEKLQVKASTAGTVYVTPHWHEETA